MADTYTTVLRGVPDLLVIYLFYFGGGVALTAVGLGTSGASVMTAGLVIGMLQSEATKLQTTWDWMPDAGVAEAVEDPHDPRVDVVRTPRPAG